MAVGRIVLHGATGYTGGLVLDALEGTEVPLVLAGRSLERLAALADRHDAEVVVADASKPDGTCTTALQPGDVLVSTVGPFGQLGAPAVEAAVRAGAHYVDSAGEGGFVRRVFEQWGPRARGHSLLLPAFGYEFVPGNLAAGLALRDGGSDAVVVDVGYFTVGDAKLGASLSSGTAATMVFGVFQGGYTYRGGRIVDAGLLPRQRRFDVDGKAWQALEVPGSEQFDIPEVFPHVRDVGTYLGWFGRATGKARILGGVAGAWSRLPLVGRIPGLLGRRLMRRTGVGPDEPQRAKTRTLVVAEASNSAGRVVARARLEGPNGYTLTGALIAWAARRLATDPPAATGACGPLGAFGVDDLQLAAAEIGLFRVD